MQSDGSRRLARQSGKASHADAIEKLKRLKREGISGLDTYKVEYGDIYDEVDEDDYNTIVKKRVQEEDDFVVDDDGEGYAETGLEIWDQPKGTNSEDDNFDQEQEFDSYKRSIAKRKKPEQIKSKNKLGAFFCNSTTMGISPLKESKAAINTAKLDQSYELMIKEFSLPEPLSSPKLSNQNNRFTMTTFDTANDDYGYSHGIPTNSPCFEDGNGGFDEQDSLTSSGRLDTSQKNVEQNSASPKQTTTAPSIFLKSNQISDDVPIRNVEKVNSGILKKSDLLKSLLPSMISSPLTSSTPKEASKIATIDKILGSNDDDQNNKQLAQPSISQNDSSFMSKDSDSCNFFWFDAYEKPNGQVILIGKVYYPLIDSFASCCVTIKNLQRNLYILPRQTINDAGEQPVEMNAIYDEISKLASQFSIAKFACKKVSRKYAFELPDIPDDADYLKLAYGYDLPQLAKDLSGSTFSHIFGTNTSALEILLIKRRIMGPCWLKLKNPQILRKNVSWCKVEIELENPKSVSVLSDDQLSQSSDPKLNVISIHITTAYNRASQTNEIVAVSMMLYTGVSMEGATAVENSGRSSFTVHAVRPLDGVSLPLKLSEAFTAARVRVEACSNERALLSFVLTHIQRMDPDVLVGHNFLGFGLPILLNRLKTLKVDRWSRIGRLHWSQWPKSNSSVSNLASFDLNFAERQLLSGRLICDTYLACKDLVKSKNYSLKELANSQLNGLVREDLDFERIPELTMTPEGWTFLVKHSEMDAWLAMQLVFKLLILPLTKQLTVLAGNLWSHTLAGSRAERNEYLLLHEFHNQKFIVPDKIYASRKAEIVRDYTEDLDLDQEDSSLPHPNGPGKSARRKPAYAGGLVLEPKVGLYENIVLLLDFNSLYPSIIQEFNICFTTVERTSYSFNGSGLLASDSVSSGTQEMNSSSTIDDIPPIPDKSLTQGILPRLLGGLVSRRRQVKKLLADSKTSAEEVIQLELRQKALKLTANSMYGCLGFAHSRFYAPALAKLITYQGRTILQATVDATQSQLGLDVIYGDTDSIMIYTDTTNPSEARKMGFAVKRLVNERYKLLEIELDGIFLKLLLLKKKKYAALVLDESANKTKLESKGLDLVRRDWCGLSNTTSSYILDKILSRESRDDVLLDIHNYLENLAIQLRKDHPPSIPINQFIIYKGLTKAPEDYADAKTQPHVTVALAMKKRSGVAPRPGDTIPYVICLENNVTVDAQSSVSSNSSSKGLAQRAFHPDDLTKNENLHLDIEWYLAQQIYPPISRLCVPIEGTDAARIAHCLGLDSKRYSSSINSLDVLEHDDTAIGSSLYSSLNELTLRQTETFAPSCTKCQTLIPMTELLRKKEDNSSALDSSGLNHSWVLGWSCPLCFHELSLGSLRFQLIQTIRSHIQRYYAAWMICDEPSCPLLRTRRLGVYERRCPSPDCRGSLSVEFSDRSLYIQLSALRRLFDVNIYLDKLEKQVTASGQSKDLSNQFQTASLLLKQSQNFIQALSETVQSYLDQSAFPIVSLAEVFSFMSLSLKCNSNLLSSTKITDNANANILC